MSDFDDSMPAAQSIFSLTEGGTVPHQKRRKGGNPTSTGQRSTITPPAPPPSFPRFSSPSPGPSPFLPFLSRACLHRT